MNGKGMPLVGIMPSTTLMLMSAWMTTIAVMPVARKRANGSSVRSADAQSAKQEDAEQQDDQQRSPQPQLFGDVGEDEVGMRLGKIEQLLLAFHQARAGEPARTDGDHRLDDVKSIALRILDKDRGTP